MTEQELNEKRARWAGFTLEGTGVNGEIPVWIEPGGSVPISPTQYYFSGKNYGLADFPNDLNACFKWLVPNIKNLTGIEFAGSDDSFASWLCKLWYGIWADRGSIQVKQDYHEAEADSPSLALCQAIDKLIDSEVKV